MLLVEVMVSLQDVDEEGLCVPGVVFVPLVMCLPVGQDRSPKFDTKIFRDGGWKIRGKAYLGGMKGVFKLPQLDWHSEFR